MSSFQIPPSPINSPDVGTFAPVTGSSNQPTANTTSNTATLQALFAALSSIQTSPSDSQNDEDGFSEEDRNKKAPQHLEKTSPTLTDPDSGGSGGNSQASYFDEEVQDDKSQGAKSPLVNSSAMATNTGKTASSSSDFTDFAKSLGLSTTTTKTASSFFKQADALSQILKNPPNGISPGEINQITSAIKEATSLGYTTIINDLIGKPEAISNLLSSYSNMPKGLANAFAVYFSDYITKAQSSTSTTEDTSDSALNTNLSSTAVADALGSFSTYAQDINALLNNYQLQIDLINAKIGMDTIEMANTICGEITDPQAYIETYGKAPDPDLDALIALLEKAGSMIELITNMMKQMTDSFSCNTRTNTTDSFSKKQELESTTLNTSSVSTTNAKTEEKSIRAMGVTLASEGNASSQEQAPSQTTLFAVKALSLASDFADSAKSIGLSASTITTASSYFETASTLAQSLLNLPKGISSTVTDKMVASIEKASAQGYAAILTDLAGKPSVLANLFTSYSGLSPELATLSSFYFSSYMTNLKSQSSNSTSDDTANSALNTDQSYTEISYALGSFAASAQDNVALMDAYQAYINGINAEIGTFSVEQAAIVDENTQTEIQKQIDDEKKAKKKNKKNKFIKDLTDTAMITVGVVMVTVAVAMTVGSEGALTGGAVMLAIGGAASISTGVASLAGAKTDPSVAIIGATGNIPGLNRQTSEMVTAIAIALAVTILTAGVGGGMEGALTMFSMVMTSTDATTTATEEAAEAAKGVGIDLGPTDRWVMAMNILVAILPLFAGDSEGEEELAETEAPLLENGSITASEETDVTVVSEAASETTSDSKTRLQLMVKEIANFEKSASTSKAILDGLEATLEGINELTATEPTIINNSPSRNRSTPLNGSSSSDTEFSG